MHPGNYITVIGTTDRKADLVKEVVEYCIDEMLPRFRTLDIVVEFDKLEKLYGSCIHVDKNEFYVEIASHLRDYKTIVRTVCHEMVHVMQGAKGLLKETKGKQRWKEIDYSNTPYSKQPWERQAFRMEEQLAKKFWDNKKNS
jgi:hypothetical protein